MCKLVERLFGITMSHLQMYQHSDVCGLKMARACHSGSLRRRRRQLFGGYDRYLVDDRRRFRLHTVSFQGLLGWPLLATVGGKIFCATRHWQPARYVDNLLFQ
jgi:hypothetical protein